MKCEFKDNSLIIKNHKLPTELANVLRRYCMNYVSTLAPKELNIYVNETAFCDEYIAHRIAMIPFKDSDKTDGLMHVSMKNNTNDYITVYSGDLKGDYTPIYDNIPIVILTPGDEINFEIIFNRGKGIEHAKYKPCYSYFKEIENGVELIIEPFGQIEDPKEIINKAIDEIEHHLKSLYEFISS